MIVSLPRPSSLSRDGIHLFCVDVSLIADRADHLMEMLCEEEKKKAGKFRYPMDSVRFIAARGFLRIILGHYLNAEPDRLKFSYGPYGKPALDTEFSQDSLTFSVSHSDRLVLYAIARDRGIGVDIECIRQDFPFEPIIERYFTPGEAALIGTLPSEVRQEVFFSYWTLKEAFIKATGRGFSLPLNQFEVAMDPPQLVSIHGNFEAASGWYLQSLHPGPGYAAGLAAEGRNLQLEYWNYRAPGHFTSGDAISSAAPIPCSGLAGVSRRGG